MAHNDRADDVIANDYALVLKRYESGMERASVMVAMASVRVKSFSKEKSSACVLHAFCKAQRASR